MPWKEPKSDGEGPPDLLDLISNLKTKLKNSFKAKRVNINNLTEEEDVLVAHCSCDSSNKFYIADVIVKCGSCTNIIYKKTITNPYKVAGIIVVLSYGVGQFVEYALTDNRYPLDVEYAVLEACTSSYKKSLSYRTYGSKKELCLCALENTMNEISYIRYKVNEEGFLKAFENNAKSCKKP